MCVCGDPNCKIPTGKCHCGCRKETRVYPNNNRALGWVKGQHAKYRHGHWLCKPRPKFRQPRNPLLRRIGLTQGKTVTISAHRYEWAMQWNWHAWWSEENDTYYARRKNDRGKSPAVVCMHSEIMRPPKGKIVDHRDSDGLNNADDNLRVATYSQNMMNRKMHTNNTSGYRGVFWDKSKKRWRYSVQADGRSIGGSTNSLKEAVRRRDDIAKKLHGEFARLARDG